MDGVHPIGIEVIRKTRGATNSRDKNNLLLIDSNLGQYRLYLFKDRVIPTARAPSYILVSGKVLGGEFYGWHIRHFTMN